MGNWWKGWFPFLAALFFASAATANVIVIPEIKTAYDITYAETEDGPVRLDITWPESGGPYPVIVYFHGGGWSLGDKSLYRHRMRILAQAGYVVFNANYRLAPIARFPAQVNDALGAVIFAKEHARKYGGDPGRVAVMGDSAGAHLSAMIAFAWDDPYFKPSYPGNGRTTAEVQAAVLLYGGYRMNWIYEKDPRLWGFVSTRPMVANFIGGTPLTKPEAYARASVSYYLHKNRIPPMLIMCGTEDAAFPESLWLHQVLEERGVEHTAFFVANARHEFNYLEDRRDFPFLRAILDFLDQELDNQWKMYRMVKHDEAATVDDRKARAALKKIVKKMRSRLEEIENNKKSAAQEK